LLAEWKTVWRLDARLQRLGEGAGLGLTAEGDGVAVETDLPFIARGFC
jgi:hypothetical protein